ncbi:hypothetical protein [Desulfitobacterium hafniense]|uniref:hypothetical protein n=1 Tax=Desulfitobacterium hafniense TaxID=49338 RepID=UPI0003714A3C|nr:hypothetical protein [Desulfitobacterium hafniense]
MKKFKDYKRYNVQEEGEQFFLQFMSQLLHKLTIDTYRARAMNSKTILMELYDVTDMVEKGIWNSVNIKLVSEEAMKLIEKDLIINKSNYVVSLKKVLQDAITGNGNYAISKSLLSGVILRLNQTYFKALIQGLKNSIGENSVPDIKWYTSSMVTELLANGFDRGYIEDKVEDVFLSSNKDFYQKFEYFAQVITPNTYVYQAILKIYPNDINLIPQQISDFEFLDNIPFNTTDPKIIKHLTSGDPRKLVKCNVAAKDPYSAAISARSLFGNSLDLLRFVIQDKVKIDIDDLCVIIVDGTEIIYESTPGLVGYIPNSLEWLPKIDHQLSRINHSSEISQTTKDKIKGALRYFRLSRESINMEHQFLNLWIALEHLLRTGERHSSIIEPITNFVPKTLALNYLTKVIRDTVELIKRSQIRFSPSISSHIDPYSLDKFIVLLENSELYDLFHRECSLNPLLKNRIEDMKELLSSPKSIKFAIEKNKKDIEWHLARMYRYRNKIVHQAAHDLNISGLTANLLSYLRDILNKVLFELSHNDTSSDLYEIYLKYQITYDSYIKALESTNSNKLDNSILIQPLKLIWP